jgi:hypothetical protein
MRTKHARMMLAVELQELAKRKKFEVVALQWMARDAAAFARDVVELGWHSSARLEQTYAAKAHELMRQAFDEWAQADRAAALAWGNL